jgi:hypothetical protein
VAYRYAVFACLGPAIGSLLFSLILRLTGGQWGDALRPYFRAGISLVPWIWLLTLPLLFLPSNHAVPAGPTPVHEGYDRPALVVVRGLVYLVIFFLLAQFSARAARKEADSEDEPIFPWLGPAGLIVLVFTLHLLADDWLLGLEPHWRSTGFPLVWMTGQAVSGFSIAVFAATCSGIDPGQVGRAGRRFGIDWGNLLLASTLSWSYVAFAQFLIIWSGNLPNEISWYARRSEGLWRGLIVVLIVFHFALPFLFLLSRRFRTFPGGLAGIALVLLAAQWVYIGWIILPAFPVSGAVSASLILATLLAGGGFFLNRYLSIARRLQEAEA